MNLYDFLRRHFLPFPICFPNLSSSLWIPLLLLLLNILLLFHEQMCQSFRPSAKEDGIYWTANDAEDGCEHQTKGVSWVWSKMALEEDKTREGMREGEGKNL